jgi:enoyl-CoA hydratase/carnithine racemase
MSVLFAEDGPIATITLNRPEKLNALSPEMLERLETIVREIDRSESIYVVILTAAGDRSFCVGADIDAWSSLRPIEMWRRWTRDGHRIFDTFARLRQPSIAAVNGYAFGGGLELALAADLRISSSTASFSAPEVKIATLPGWAGTKRLPDAIGTARAKELIFTGRRIDAETAECWGLVNRVVAPESLLDQTRALAEEIAANAPISVQLAKQAIDGNPLDLEAMAGALAGMTDDAREGIAAFRERRTAHFEGH